jgi:phosphoglycolate phosphatase-like HAD superfamily hydrolase
MLDDLAGEDSVQGAAAKRQVAAGVEPDAEQTTPPGGPQRVRDHVASDRTQVPLGEQDACLPTRRAEVGHDRRAGPRARRKVAGQQVDRQLQPPTVVGGPQVAGDLVAFVPGPVRRGGPGLSSAHRPIVARRGVSMAIDHIVWDWNGTLFDDGDALVLATVDAFVVTGLGAVTRETYQAHFTRPISEFYDQLAGRVLTPAEQVLLNEHFQSSYARRLAELAVHPDAVRALTGWREAGRTQSLLSMYPHERLSVLPQVREIAHYFVRVDGTHDDAPAQKEPHLRRHLSALGADPRRVLVVGDNLDDVHAARACGVPCVLYRPAERALVSHARVHDLGIPVVADLPAAVRWALAAESSSSGGEIHAR